MADHLPSRWRRRPVDVLPSPNIWYHRDVYECENEAQDVDGEIWRVLRSRCDWTGRDVLDLGCGDGFHLSRFAGAARSVTGVEPHPPLVAAARARVAGLPGVRVRHGAAQRIPLPDAEVDLVHARTAYFFGPGCEPGLAEVERVLRPGGTLAVVDLDVTADPYGRWMRADLPDYDPAEVDSFFARQGFRCERVVTRWRFASAAALESVLRIEFSARVAERALAETVRARAPGDRGVEFPVTYRVLSRDKPAGLVPARAQSRSAVSPGSGTSPRIP
ncbi:SAM-dependent methyltransferase [Amycolatopsis antarctica]|uniref:SAM-dependent methyltransferase n=1 Tax=Amycolatopsis antarctica TaxID=1854586 RepID=A0A263D7J3_9PSEU|nr:SAM-dependent methyltransferase [Amycolatopsis antarctica]